MPVRHLISSSPVAGQPIVETIDPRLLLSPVDFLFADHYRQRVVLNHIEWLAATPEAANWVEVARTVLGFLRRDLPNHVADEERDLLAIMRKRCGRADNIETVFEVLSAEHAGDEQMAEDVIAGIESQLSAPNERVDAAFVASARAFAATQRRHLAWENALVLPVARKRLTEGDLRRLGRKMAARRGIAFPKPDAGDRALVAIKSMLRE
ncbi:MAG TPA: hemerythrin domain-containing protein [Alphaproteobacteria bacterium]|nr:hemerythrin domain-containing protein [Alphaproteobacteria bacterium]